MGAGMSITAGSDLHAHEPGSMFSTSQMSRDTHSLADTKRSSTDFVIVLLSKLTPRVCSACCLGRRAVRISPNGGCDPSFGLGFARRPRGQRDWPLPCLPAAPETGAAGGQAASGGRRYRCYSSIEAPPGRLARAGISSEAGVAMGHAPGGRPRQYIILCYTI